MKHIIFYILVVILFYINDLLQIGNNHYLLVFIINAQNNAPEITYVILTRACGAMDNASDYESGDSRFESWQARTFLCENKHLFFLSFLIMFILR